MIERMEFIGITILGRQKSDVYRMTVGEIISQYSLYRYYFNDVPLKNSKTLGQIFS